ncbi:MAG TPA: hypothetical protein VF746_28315 [Longimicrobium sp.]
MVLALAACSDQPTAPRQGLGSTPHASVTPGRVAMHRLFNAATNDHQYSVYPYTDTPPYTLEHYNYFFLEPAPTSGHIPLFICVPGASSTSSDHWLSTDPGCEGRDVIVVEAYSGYMATSQLPGTVPLYRQYNALLDDTFHTISLSEAQYAEAHYNYSTPVLMGYVYLTE